MAVEENATPEMIIANNPLVYSLIHESALSFDEAVAVSEGLVAQNPFMILHQVPCIESDALDIEDDPLVEAFIWALTETHCDEKLLAEAMMYDTPAELAEATGEMTMAKAAGNAAEGIKNSASSAVDKVSNAASTVSRDVRRVANDAKHKVVNPLATRMYNAVKAISDANEEEKREMVISGSFFYKLRHLFKKFLLFWWVRPAIFALLPFNPITILIKIVVTVAMGADLIHKGYKATAGDGNLVPETRNRVIQELELELRMTREKIEDARGAGDREKKYQLMRLENKIEQEIARVKYGASI
jgi:uncharacterized protein (UPF0147 family)